MIGFTSGEFGDQVIVVFLKPVLNILFQFRVAAHIILLKEATPIREYCGYEWVYLVCNNV